MRRTIDVTLAISPQLPVWPGDPSVHIQALADPGDGAVSELSLGSHTGTHVDPPSHYLPGGCTVDQLDLDTLVGPAWIARVPGVGHVSARDLERAAIPRGLQRILLRTRNSDRPFDHFDPGFTALTEDGAHWLIAHSVRLVGIDGPSVDPFHLPGHPVHLALLRAGIIIVENLKLDAVSAGPCDLICLPLKLAGGDGAPVRALILQDE